MRDNKEKKKNHRWQILLNYLVAKTHLPLAKMMVLEVLIVYNQLKIFSGKNHHAVNVLKFANLQTGPFREA